MLHGGGGDRDSPWEDELLHVDQTVRKGLDAQDGETILAAAHRIIGDPSGATPKRLAAARVLIDAHETRDGRWEAMKQAAAIFTATH